MFNKEKLDETKLVFRRKKEIYPEKEAIEKNKQSIEESLLRIILGYKKELNFQNKHEPISFTEDKNYFYVSIILLTPNNIYEAILSKLIE